MGRSDCDSELLADMAAYWAWVAGESGETDMSPSGEKDDIRLPVDDLNGASNAMTQSAGISCAARGKVMYDSF